MPNNFSEINTSINVDSASVQLCSSCQPGELVNCEGNCAAQCECYQGGRLYDLPPASVGSELLFWSGKMIIDKELGVTKFTTWECQETKREISSLIHKISVIKARLLRTASRVQQRPGSA